jgi:hypothetical protein
LASAVGAFRLIYIPSKLIVHANATATTSNILAHERLFRFGIVTELIAAVLGLFVPLALYRLLRGVDQALAVVMVILGGLMQVPLFFANSMTDAATLLFLRGPAFVAAFERAQREALAVGFLNLHHHLELANCIFWGLWLLPFGILAYRSRFLPRLLGVWLTLACFAWVAFSITGLLSPTHEDQVFALTQPVVLGEVATMLWLTIMGAKPKPGANAASAPA